MELGRLVQPVGRLPNRSCKHVADCFNLTFCVPRHRSPAPAHLLQMPTQFMMAILFCTCDGILNFQNIYYKYWCPRKRLQTQQQLEHQQQQAEAREIQALLESTGTHKPALEAPSGSGSDPNSPPLKPPAPDNSSKQGISPAHKLHSLSAGTHITYTHALALFDRSRLSTQQQ